MRIDVCNALHRNETYLARTAAKQTKKAVDSPEIEKTAESLLEKYDLQTNRGFDAALGMLAAKSVYYAEQADPENGYKEKLDAIKLATQILPTLRDLLLAPVLARCNKLKDHLKSGFDKLEQMSVKINTQQHEIERLKRENEELRMKIAAFDSIAAERNER